MTTAMRNAVLDIWLFGSVMIAPACAPSRADIDRSGSKSPPIKDRWCQAQNIVYASAAFAGRETQRFPPLFSRTVVVGFSSDLPADVIAIWLKPLSGSQPTSLRLCRQLPARSGGGTLGHRGREEFPPLMGLLIRPLLASPLTGESSAGRHSGRSAPSRTNLSPRRLIWPPPVLDGYK